MQSAVVYSGTHADRVVLTVNEAVYGVTAEGFSIIVAGEDVPILSVRSHPTDEARIWVKLSNPIQPGQAVSLHYAGSGTVEDSDGSAMEAGSVNVSNET
jgi:hypothetical protein